MPSAIRRAAKGAGKTQRPARSKTVPRIVEVARKLGRQIPASEQAAVPRDFSDQLDHYIYGTPKR